MSHSRAGRNTFNEYLDLGSQIIRDSLQEAGTATPILLGNLTLRRVSREVGKSTASFYSHWGSIEEYKRDLLAKLVTESLSSPERVRIIYNQARELPEQHPIDTLDRFTLFDQYTETCAAEVADKDPHLAVRWHVRPYVTPDQIADTHAIQSSKAALGLINGWGIGKPSEEGYLPISPTQLLDVVDYRAFIEAGSSE